MATKQTAPGTYKFILKHDAELRQGKAILDGYATTLTYTGTLYVLVISDPVAEWFTNHPEVAFANAQSRKALA